MALDVEHAHGDRLVGGEWRRARVRDEHVHGDRVVDATRQRTTEGQRACGHVNSVNSGEFWR